MFLTLRCHHAYMGKEVIPWLHRQDILARFSNDASKASVLFQNFTNQGVGESKRMEFHHGSHLGQILGDDHFAERALRASGQSGMVKPPSVEEIIKAVYWHEKQWRFLMPGNRIKMP